MLSRSLSIGGPQRSRAFLKFSNAAFAIGYEAIGSDFLPIWLGAFTKQSNESAR